MESVQKNQLLINQKTINSGSEEAVFFQKQTDVNYLGRREIDICGHREYKEEHQLLFYQKNKIKEPQLFNNSKTMWDGPTSLVLVGGFGSRVKSLRWDGRLLFQKQPCLCLLFQRSIIKTTCFGLLPCDTTRMEVWS